MCLMPTETTVEALAQENESMKGTIEQLEKKVAQLEASYNDLNSSYLTVVNERDTYLNRIDSLTVEKGILISQNDELKSLYEKAKSDLFKTIAKASKLPVAKNTQTKAES